MSRTKRVILLTLGIAFFIGLPFSQPWAADPTSKKTMRQIGVMESIIDKVLIDSPFFLVSGGDNARGLYIDGFGAIFTFDASLVTKRWMFLSDGIFSLDKDFKIETDEDGDRVIVIRSKSDKDKLKEDLEQKDEEWEPEEVFEKGKQELLQTILDYGESLSALKNEEHIVVAAFLRGSDYFKERQISRLILKAKVKDLRDFSAERINESTAKSRIEIEEY